ncbi:MAG: homogentisate 1,2-dioxygenase [Gemmatimonadales bacterium]
MPFYHTLGQIPRKRHTVFRRPDGGLYAEELMGHEGFIGTSSLLYHEAPPTTVKSARQLRKVCWEADTSTSLRHRHFRTAAARVGGSPTMDRTPVLFNQDIAMLWVAPDQEDQHLYRNSEADEVIYLAEGEGVLESSFGELPVRAGDYVVIHRNITHRWRLDYAKGPARMLVFESRGHVRTPKRYRNEFGQLLEGAPYSERDIRCPMVLKTREEKGDFPILVKQYDAINELVLDHHPFDVVGWDGYYYPWAFNIHDF